MDIIIENQIFKQYDENYYVSEYGDVYSTYSKKILKHSIDKDGYHRVDLHQKHKKIHQLVYITWIGEIPKGKQINHIDDNKNNNHYSNLYAGTQKENIHDKLKNNKEIGNMFYLTLFDKEKNKTITFCPSKNFIKYSGHPCKNGSISRMFKKNWFKKRYEIIDFKKVDTLSILESVTTMGDECNPVE